MFGIFKRLEDLETKLEMRTKELNDRTTYQQRIMFIHNKEVALRDVVKALVDYLELNVTTKSATPEKVEVTRKPSAAYVQAVLTGEDDA
jgi:hypothetical protein